MRTDRPGIARRTLFAVQRPWVTVLLIVVALLDLFTLTRSSYYSSWRDPTGSRVGNVVGSLLEPTPLRESYSPYGRAPDAHLGWTADEDDVRPVAWDDRFSAKYRVSAGYSVLRSGTWGLTREVREFGWDVEEKILDGSVAVPPTVRERIDELFYATVYERGDARWIALFDAARAAGSNSYRAEVPVWSGYIRNLASITNALLLLVSFGWIGRTRRVRRRWRKLARCICPDCGHTLDPARRSEPCPECGIAHPLRQSPDADSTNRWLADRIAARSGRALRRPLVSALLLFLLMHDLLLLPTGAGFFSGSRVRNSLPVGALRADAGDGHLINELVVGVHPHADGNEYALFDPRSPQPDWIVIKRMCWSTGFWAPVTFHYSVTVDWRENLYPADVRERFDELRQFLEDEAVPFWASAAANPHASRMIHAGHLHNAIAIAAFLGLIVSLTWIPARASAHRARRRERHGQCGYCLNALNPSETICNICGTPTTQQITQ